MRIRYGKKEDVSAIVSFNAAMALETENKTLDETILLKGVQGIFSDPSKGFYLIAEDGNQTCGQLMITKEWSDWRNGYFWWIQSVYILPDYRGKGIYRQLHDKVRELAKDEGNICGIRLYVECDNVHAKSVYKAVDMIQTDYHLFEEDWTQ